ncbi:MAG TPA: alpha-galactosidase [Spirochaetia bacterium]|nr:alpha-galactosidase [Spirochaetia bacterium]
MKQVDSKGGRSEIKIAYIGGGSRAWAPKLFSDLALSPYVQGEIALYDVDYEASKANIEVGRTIFGHRDAASKFTVAAVRALDEALDGADFVVLSIEPGPTTMRYADLEIPRKHGISQTVGDTTGPGGILRALRTVPVYEEFAHRIMARCPSAWVINYTNPMTICTATLFAAEPTIKAFGCCHEVFSTQERLADLAALWFGIPVPHRREISLDIAGVNHFTFATRASFGGEDLLPRLREMIAAPDFFADDTARGLERKSAEQWFDNDGLIAYDYLRRFGVLGAAGDRHLAEFVPWYLQNEESILRWGVVLTPYEWRVRRMTSFSRRDPNEPLLPSGEEGVDQMHALLGFSTLVTNVNVPNHGQLPALPDGAVVESYAHLSEAGLRPIVSAPLPELLASHVRHISQIQQTTLEAARRKDRDLAFQALLCDPLVRIPTDEARRMFDEMLVYVKDYLPGWKV